jgi:ubiquinone/menaquinone biosynthesis C-methylase UbiE
MTHSISESKDLAARETYTSAGSSAFARFIASRTAAKQATFFLPYLQPGMTLLDCGCGPGTITAGLAQIVAPGQTVGIDSNTMQLELALRQSAEQIVPNLRFETASVYTLPFEDNTFDAVFSHAVFEHLREPLTALQEIQRVLKPGGIVGVRSVDKDGQLLAPREPLLVRYWEMMFKLGAINGATTGRGKELGVLLRQAGFVRVKATASYDVYSAALWAETAAEILQEGNFVQQLLSQGLTDCTELETIRRAWLAWGQHPDAFFADAFGEAVGWKA